MQRKHENIKTTSYPQNHKKCVYSDPGVMDHRCHFDQINTVGKLGWSFKNPVCST